MSSTAISHFPVEIGIQIFNNILYPDGSFSYSKFIRARWLVCRSSSEWMRAVNAYPKFWTHISIDLETPSELVDTYLNRAGSLPIKLCLDFHSIEQYFEVRRSVQTIQDLATERMVIIQPLMHRVEQILMETEDRTLHDCMQEALRGLHAPLLRDIIVRFTHTRTKWDYGALNSPSWTTGHLPALERVHLYRTLFPFPFASATLRELRIYEVPHERAFNFADIRNIITGSPRLEELALWGIFCSEVQAGHILSTSIHTLRIKFNHASVSRLAANFDFPLLRTVHVEIAHPSDVVCAVRCSQLWKKVTHLKINDNGRDVYNLPLLFDSFYSVTHLDITECNGTLLSELTRHSGLNMSHETTTVFRELQSFKVAHATGRDVLQFCLRHGAKDLSDGHHMKLREVRMTIMVASHTECIEWMKEHIQSFRLYRMSNGMRVGADSEAARLTV
ncbi:hypothetical protein C8F04DRAFT_1255832 [Mycena alexandri]|uniref:F-box domain-containing protein n=1 Tax=Mycena alexandri TaxID=1745969 RepID=A0AAD6T2L1_9AGAR|nr:hypothetical protein C8F04DRAFT_1255832 [Mycena alexandri]